MRIEDSDFYLMFANLADWQPCDRNDMPDCWARGDCSNFKSGKVFISVSIGLEDYKRAIFPDTFDYLPKYSVLLTTATSDLYDIRVHMYEDLTFKFINTSPVSEEDLNNIATHFKELLCKSGYTQRK